MQDRRAQSQGSQSARLHRQCFHCTLALHATNCSDMMKAKQALTLLQICFAHCPTATLPHQHLSPPSPIHSYLPSLPIITAAVETPLLKYTSEYQDWQQEMQKLRATPTAGTIAEKGEDECEAPKMEFSKHRCQSHTYPGIPGESRRTCNFLES